MIHAVFFDIGGTVHTQDATPESDRDYIRRLWCFLHMNHIYTAEMPEQLLEHINAGAKAYKSYTEQELIELPPDMIWQKFFLKDFDIPAEKLAGLGEELLLWTAGGLRTLRYDATETVAYDQARNPYAYVRCVKSEE